MIKTSVLNLERCHTALGRGLFAMPMAVPIGQLIFRFINSHKHAHKPVKYETNTSGPSSAI